MLTCFASRHDIALHKIMTVTDRSICRVVYSRRQQTTHWSRCIGREMSTLTDSVIPSPEYRTRDIEKRRGDGIVVDGWMDGWFGRRMIN